MRLIAAQRVDRLEVLIAGAGIGWLATALFLHRSGIEVEVFERADEIRELGVGINILPHAVLQFADVDLMQDLDARGIRTRERFYANRFGQIVWQKLRALNAGIPSRKSASIAASFWAYFTRR